MKLSDKIQNGEASVAEIYQQLGLDFGKAYLFHELNDLFVMADSSNLDVTVYGHNGIVRLYDKETLDCVAGAQVILDRANSERIALALAAALLIATGRDVEVAE